MKRKRDYTMADFRAEMHRRTHGEQYGPKQQNPARSAITTQAVAPARRLVTRPGLRGRSGQLEKRENFFKRLVRSCRARLAELEQRSPADVMPCPWGAALGGKCLEASVTIRGQRLDSCRCGGKGEVTVGFMVAHYKLVLAEYGGIE